jgi:predicted PurR-regulated permease PerM
MLATLVDLLPLGKEDTQELLDVIGESLTANVYGVLGVAVAQGVLLGIALAIAGIPSPLTWTVVATICAMLPVIGPTVVWIPAAIWLFASGSYGMGVFLVIWGVVVVGLADNILRPLLVVGRTKQNPLLVFLSILGGTSAFGLMGLFLGPLLVSVTVAVFYVLRRETSEGA